MRELFRAMARLASAKLTVLLLGEPGTGKELVARSLHRLGSRSDQPFIALNIAAIPHDLIAADLFGHESGRPGRLEQAHGGTLFLDEIGDLPLDLQTRLLRVVMDGEFFPVGGDAPVRCDTRIIAASHRDLESLVACGCFREDLYQRLNLIRLRLPALRERRGDMPALLRHFLAKASAELNIEPRRLRPEVEAYLCRIDWPGNVRQLENACHWICLMSRGTEIDFGDLPLELLRDVREPGMREGEVWEDAFQRWVDVRLRLGDDNVAKEAIKSAENILIATALRFTHGRKQEAAKLLGYGRNTLTRKLSESNWE